MCVCVRVHMLTSVYDYISLRVIEQCVLGRLNFLLVQTLSQIHFAELKFDVFLFFIRTQTLRDG